MKIAGKEVNVNEIIKATLVRDALWNQMVTVGNMVSRFHATTISKHAPPINLAKNIRQHVTTPWGDPVGASITSLSDTNWGSNQGILI